MASSRATTKNGRTSVARKSVPAAAIPLQSTPGDADAADMDETSGEGTVVDETLPEPTGDEDLGETTEDDGDDMGKHAANATEPDLDEDPDTSIVASLCLHMLSEHSIAGVLHLDDEALAIEHRRRHQDTGQHHGIGDERFRPGRALAVALLGAPRQEAQPEPDPV